MAYEKPLIVSEFGGGAKAGMHGPVTERWTEEYQADLYRHQLVMLSKIPQLRGMSPWDIDGFPVASAAAAGGAGLFQSQGAGD